MLGLSNGVNVYVNGFTSLPNPNISRKGISSTLLEIIPHCSLVGVNL